ncbi:MAG: DUF2164 domain-containing protein [Phycisphaerae bacterium]
MAAESQGVVRLDPHRQELAVAGIQEFFSAQFGEPISDFRTEQLLEFFCTELGPLVYDQALEDARSWLFEKLQDLSIDLRKEA